MKRKNPPHVSRRIEIADEIYKIEMLLNKLAWRLYRENESLRDQIAQLEKSKST